MTDLRKTASRLVAKETGNIALKGAMLNKKTAGYDVNEETVTEMLQTMGVEPTPQIVQEAIGYLSSNAMEFNMTNLYEFLKTKDVMSNRKDLRKKKING